MTPVIITIAIIVTFSWLLIEPAILVIDGVNAVTVVEPSLMIIPVGDTVGTVN